VAPARIERCAVTAFVGFLLVAMMTARPYNHDDELYVTAGVLARHLILYKDFVYNQPPFYPLFLAVIFRGLASYYYLAARITSFVLAIAGARLMYVIACRTTGSPRLALAAPVLFATSTTVQSAGGSARNDILPCVLMLACAALVLAAPRVRRRDVGALTMALAGLLAALAVSCKLVYLFLPAATLLYLLAVRPWPSRATTAFVAGLLAGASLDLYYLAIARDQLLFNLFDFHLTLKSEWYVRNGEGWELEPLGRLYDAATSFVRDGVAPPALVTLGVALAILWRRGPLPALRDLTGLVATPTGYVALLAALSLPCAFEPYPSMPQYFVPTFALGSLLTLAAVARLGTPGRTLRRVLAAAFVAAIFVGTVRAVTYVPRMLSPRSWVAMQIHADGVAVRDGAGGKPICVATLSPIRPLDAGLTILPELASGPFLFRSGDLLSAARLDELRATSPSRLPELLDRRRPGAILVGFENDFTISVDDHFRDYARSRGFTAASPPAPEVWYSDGPGVGCVK